VFLISLLSKENYGLWQTLFFVVVVVMWQRCICNRIEHIYKWIFTRNISFPGNQFRKGLILHIDLEYTKASVLIDVVL